MSVAYCILDDVRRYIGTSKTVDDALLTDFINRATARIDSHCQRQFAGREETRFYDAVRDVDGRVLILDDDLLSATSITNGDGAVLADGVYVFLPLNGLPKWAIRLRASSAIAWTWRNDPEGAIAVEGIWGYSEVPPADIAQAAVRLAAWYYHQTEAPFETQGLPELGVVTVPSDMPPDIKALLAPYQRSTVGNA